MDGEDKTGHLHFSHCFQTFSFYRPISRTTSETEAAKVFLVRPQVSDAGNKFAEADDGASSASPTRRFEL